jgi:lipoprotein-anchoring transpeptidase ErfK/SrfK
MLFLVHYRKVLALLVTFVLIGTWLAMFPHTAAAYPIREETVENGASQEDTVENGTPQEEPVEIGTTRSIVVSLTDQWLYAYDDGELVFDAPVSTGKDGFETPTGDFAIYEKLPLQTMSGTIGNEEYLVPDVPNVMYIYGGVALHGTYWHDLFGAGERMSHGCINLPLDAAAWLYDWADIGTPVTVVE